MEFHKWRNEILNISPEIIDERIRDYCKENNIAVTRKLLSKNRREKILMLDSYEAVRNAVWDFLKIQGEVNALSLANLVRDIIEVEKGEVLRSNEDDLFHKKQVLGEFDDFKKTLSEMPQIKTARQLLEARGLIKPAKKEFGEFDTLLKRILPVPPENKEP